MKREDEDIYSILDSLKRVVRFHPKKMFCSFSGLIDRPQEAIQHKIEYHEKLQKRIEEGLRQGLFPQEIRQRLLGRRDRYRFLSAGQISKQNLINAFLRTKRG